MADTKIGGMEGGNLGASPAGTEQFWLQAADGLTDYFWSIATMATWVASQTNVNELADGSIALTATITFVIDGGGSAITTGIKGDLQIPFACTINEVTLLGDQSGSIVIDIWKDTYANFPPTVADTITAAAKPTISTATKSNDATLTGWTTSITADDILRFNVDSVTSIQRVTINLDVTKT